jgi:hypothetical protein
MSKRIVVLPGKRGPRIQIVRPRILYVGPPMMKRIVVLPGKRGPRIQIVRPPAMKRIAIWPAGRPGARRFGQWTITRRGAIFVGPGSIVAAPPGGPGCVTYSRVGPAGVPPFGR